MLLYMLLIEFLNYKFIMDGLIQFWKLWLNLCSFQWLNPILNLVRSFKIRCGTNNADQNQPKDITVQTLKTDKKFTKKYPEIRTITTTMLQDDKKYSFWRTKLDEKNQLLKTKCNNFPQTYFLDQYGSIAVWQCGVKWKFLIQIFPSPSGDW